MHGWRGGGVRLSKRGLGAAVPFLESRHRILHTHFYLGFSVLPRVSGMLYVGAAPASAWLSSLALVKPMTAHLILGGFRLNELFSVGFSTISLQVSNQLWVGQGW